jgi:hypothetical protein
LARTIWRSGHEQAASILAEWVTHQQKAGVLREGQPPHILARQVVDLAIANAQFCGLLGIPASVDRDESLKAAIETFLCGRLLQRPR